MIDIVLLLIIFFVLVCRFIESEGLPVRVPDGCGFAKETPQEGIGGASLTVTRGAGHDVVFAVGSERVRQGRGADELVAHLSRLIDARLAALPEGRRVVTLRVDRDICFGEAQYALAAIAASSARDIRLAAQKDEDSD